MKGYCAIACLFLTVSTAYAGGPQGEPHDQAQVQTEQGQKDAPAQGASSAPQSPIDPVKEADIRRLLELTGAMNLGTQMMNSMEKSLKPLLLNSLPPGDYRDKLVDLWFEKFRGKINMQQIVDGAVPLYAKYLSDDEIKGLIAFYQTPLGQKAVSVLPELSAEMQSQNTKLGQEMGRQSMQEVLSENPDLANALVAAQKSAHPQ